MFLPGPVRETRRSHRLIGSLIFSKTHVAIDTQQRSFGIRNQVRTDSVKPRPEVLNEPQKGIVHEFFVAPFVLLKPFAVIVLTKIAEELEKLRSEVNSVLHW